MSSSMNSSGGGSMHRPSKRARVVKTYAQKRSSAYDRTLARLGQERIDGLKQKWASLNIRSHGANGDGDVGDGIITCLQKLKFSFIEKHLINILLYTYVCR